jgi:hypothetical protein
MKPFSPLRLFKLFFCSLLIIVPSLQNQAQSCCGNHINEVYSTVNSATVIYGSNLPNADGSSRNVSFRLYTPIGDNCTKRPLIVFMHGGGFISGDNSMMQQVCEEFARRGYAAAGVNYRTGWLAPTPYCPVDTSEQIRAFYRSVQDTRGAIRYLKNNYTSYGIDTNFVFVGGWSAGAYGALGVAYMSDSEKPVDAGPLPDVTIGAITYTRPDLGTPQGYLNMGNHTASIKGVLSLAGAMFYSQHLTMGDPPMIVFNNQQDAELIPYNNYQNWWGAICNSNSKHASGQQLFSADATLLNIINSDIIYDEPACNHDLHLPCFPYFEQEMDTAARFFNKLMFCPVLLPVVQNSFSVTYNKATGMVTGSADILNDPPGTIYFVERGMNPGQLQKIPVKISRENQTVYFTDDIKMLSSPHLFYRLGYTSISGERHYSDIKPVHIQRDEINATCIKNILSIYCKIPVKTLAVFDFSGRLLQNSQFEPGKQSVQVTLNESASAGKLLLIKIGLDDGRTYVVKCNNFQ